MKKTETYIFDGRTFEVTTVLEAGFRGEMAHSFIYEVVRPNARFFRTRMIDDKTFWALWARLRCRSFLDFECEECKRPKSGISEASLREGGGPRSGGRRMRR